MVTNKTNVYDKKCIKTIPIFSLIPLSNYIMPILHTNVAKVSFFIFCFVFCFVIFITNIFLVNNLLDHFIAEMQATTEVYTSTYMKAEKEFLQSKFILHEAKAEFTNFMIRNHDYICDLKNHDKEYSRFLYSYNILSW